MSPEKPKSIHYEPEGIFVNKHPDPEAQAFVDIQIDERDANLAAFHECLETAPNLNELYKTEIATVKSLFEEDSLEIAPITVLDAETFKEVALLADPNGDPALNDGFFFGGRVIVAERKEQVKELFGSRAMLGLMIHEAAHSTMSDEHAIITTKIVEGTDEENPTMMRVLAPVQTGGFRKYRLDDKGNPEYEGNFFEEGFADLSRVRYIKRAGQEPHIEGRTSGSPHGIIFFGEGATLDPQTDGEKIAIPVEFASAATNLTLENSEVVIPHMEAPANLAAFGLDLLDKALPGLYGKMQAARKNPALFATVINEINSIHPNLYQTLRTLKYNRSDFKKGIQIIQEALAGRSIEQQA